MANQGKSERRNALGRGLSALIPTFEEEKVDNSGTKKAGEEKLSTNNKQKVDKSVENTQNVVELPLSKVEPRPNQPRMVFDEGALQELAASIKEHGVLQPILVCAVDEHYEIIAGERRWRAAKQAGLLKIPALVREFTEQAKAEIALIENLQRENLNPIEEATAYRQLIDEYHMKQEELAERLAKSRSAITNSLRLLKLDERVQAMVMDGTLSEGHARTLLSLSDKKLQFEAAGQVQEKQLSVRETERLVKRLQQPAPEPKADWREADQLVYDEMEQQLRRGLGAPVSVKRSAPDKGQIVIDYYSVEEFERLFDILKQERG